MPQMLLIPDPRPLVERLGADFFRQAPESPGVYLMRDTEGAVLYVGKAKNLRKRLQSYRVANPDRMPRRRLRLLRAAARIEFRECADEASALSAEAELLRALRPRFNRAGTWPATPRFLVWRVNGESLELGVSAALSAAWHSHGPLGAAVFGLRGLLLRLCWCAMHPERGLAGMPIGWFGGLLPEIIAIPASSDLASVLHEVDAWLVGLFGRRPNDFLDWVRTRTSNQLHTFESAALNADLESLAEYLAQD